ncbi:restriction endonuclease subunit S [Tenacibaculum finnmarkense]|uniref:restriction endonuclease subunit S n=1 Tax=Tenacibaculum finnmarkense TaxID=2781243 RepID=UPI001E3F5708|nr:restriction endonuclease subunit S [Tenacibaculum finnmarkense]MCD8402755.1 restriction endonuclease subunit S [Tenacibaculum finnmarkense genomovar finnmarkense]
MNNLLKTIADYSKSRISLDEIDIHNYVSTDNLLQNKLGKVDAEKMPTQSSNNVTRFDKGDILIANIRPYLKKIWLAKYTGGSSSDVLTFKVNKEYNSTFVYYSLFRDDFFEHMMNGSKGTKMPREDKNQILDFPIPDFEIGYQKSIAKVLSDLDSKIAINNKINQELEAMAKTLYDYWFVQFDFPDKNGKPYKSSEGKMIFNEDLKREIPVGWEVKELASKADFKNGKGMKKELLSDIGKTEKSLFNNTVIAIGRVGANYGEIHYSIDPCWITDNAVTSQPKSEIYLWWLLLTLKTINYSNISGGSAQPLITQGKLKALQFPIPNSFLLDEFHKIANPNYIKINNILKQNQKLSELRDWLLPMLMNRQVRVGE